MFTKQSSAMPLALKRSPRMSLRQSLVEAAVATTVDKTTAEVMADGYAETGLYRQVAGVTN
jgi:hypothetical protein